MMASSAISAHCGAPGCCLTAARLGSGADVFGGIRAGIVFRGANLAGLRPAGKLKHAPPYYLPGGLVGRFYSRAELVEQRALWKRQGKTVVFTNGCYDLLHPGHVRLLEQARSLGDVLILALNSDASVRRMKGLSRPLIAENERAAMALALSAVDAVTLFDEDTPRELIAEVLPDVLVKGADWSHFIAGREEVEAAGGRVLTISLEPGYSTTNIIEGMINQP